VNARLEHEALRSDAMHLVEDSGNEEGQLGAALLVRALYARLRGCE